MAMALMHCTACAGLNIHPSLGTLTILGPNACRKALKRCLQQLARSHCWCQVQRCRLSDMQPLAKMWTSIAKLVFMHMQ